MFHCVFSFDFEYLFGGTRDYIFGSIIFRIFLVDFFVKLVFKIVIILTYIKGVAYIYFFEKKKLFIVQKIAKKTDVLIYL